MSNLGASLTLSEDSVQYDSGTGQRETHAQSKSKSRTSRAADDVADNSIQLEPAKSEDFSFAMLPKLLRVLGATTLVVSVSIFLLQGWENGNDVYRLLLLLGHSAALTIIGFASGHFLKESKGARLLVTLGLASVPANFAILGAFIYSQFGFNPGDLPQFVVWRVESLSMALTTLAISIIVLAPIVLVAFKVLARHSALPLSAMYLIGNGLLLVPLRDPLSTSLAMVMLTVAVLWFNARTAKTDATLRTWEGYVARLLQLVPVGIIFGRTAWLYSGDAFVFTAMSAIVVLMLRHFTMLMPRQTNMRGYLEKFSILPALTTAYGVAMCIDSFAPVIADGFLVPIFALISAGLVFEIGSRAANGGAAYRRIAAVFVAVGLLGQLWLDGNVATAAVCLAAGLGLVIYGYSIEQRIVFASGVLLLATGLIYQIQFAITTFSLGSWGSLALLGVLAIVAGSVLERHGSLLKLKVATWKSQVQAWNY